MTSDTEMRRVVLVEDEPALRENYSLALGRAGFDVLSFAAADPALESKRVLNCASSSGACRHDCPYCF